MFHASFDSKRCTFRLEEFLPTAINNLLPSPKLQRTGRADLMDREEVTARKSL